MNTAIEIRRHLQHVFRGQFYHGRGDIQIWRQVKSELGEPVERDLIQLVELPVRLVVREQLSTRLIQTLEGDPAFI